MPKLERIEISADAIPRIHFPVLSRMSGLRELELRRTYSDNEFRSIGDIQKLQRLKLGSLYGNDILAQLQKLKNLESLEYTGGVRLDVLAKALPQLRNLAFPSPSQYSKELTEAIPFLESLETLTIPEPSPTDKDFGPNLAKLKNLKRLIIQSSYKVPDVKKLQAELPGITVEGIKK